MKANELRIGNYIYNPVQKINFKVDLKTIGNIINDNLRRSKKNEKYFYKPIPLTEETLLKCGFKEKVFRDNESLSFDRFYLNGFYLERLNEEDFFISENIDQMIGNFDIKIKHLHQLQNLYFALTQKELEIKL